jgi:hypothetical protein
MTESSRIAGPGDAWRDVIVEDEAAWLASMPPIAARDLVAA